MSDHEHDNSCAEYNEVSRRQFLGTAGVVTISAMLPTWLPRIVMAQTASSRDIIISVFLSGGVDGMSMVAPYGDPAYYTGRPTISLARPDAAGASAKLTALDDFFGFSPGMAPLYPAFQAGDLLVVHATGSTNNSRSHFDAQRYMEVGKPADPTVVTGWLGRHLATVSPLKPTAALRALGITTGMPRTLSGAPKALPIPNPASFTIGGTAATAVSRAAFMANNYADASDPVHANALDATNTISLLQSINVAGYVAKQGAVYPNTTFGSQLKAAAALIKADVGVEAIHTFNGGWDTHSAQGTQPGGYMHGKMTDLSTTLAAFYADVIQGSTVNGVTVVIVSEFGRNARENGNNGTDHGRGNVMYAMGKKIAGGKVLTNGWPGLAKENLESGQDLRVTLDHRDVLAEIVQNRLLNPNVGAVFPGYTPKFYSVTRP
jgi:uncharacterized protein (DUF1501 family)